MGRWRRRLLRGVALLPAASLAACLRPSSRPVEPRIRQIRLEGQKGLPGQGTLVLMLPGIASPPEEFIEAGFPAALASRAPGAEVRLLDSHYGYYEDRSILTRLMDEQVTPARQQGFDRIWLVGISLGGLGSLGLLADVEDNTGGTAAPATPSAPAAVAGAVAGVVALAPYLGTAGLAREIHASGGPAAWAATPASTHPESGQPRPPLERRLWRHLATRRGGAQVYLGYGSDDRFAHSHRLLAPLLPPAHVATRPGGHDWPVWRELWADWLDRHGRALLTSG